MEKMQKLDLRMPKLDFRRPKLNFPGIHWHGLDFIGASQKNPEYHSVKIQKPQPRWASTLTSKGILEVECRLLMSKPIEVTRDLKSRKEQVFWELTYELLRFACEVPYLITSTKYPANITKHFLKINSN